jgi:hypothetical protein
MRLNFIIFMLCLGCFVNGQTLSFQTWNMSTPGSVFSVNEFNSIAVDKTGRVWAGSTLGGLYYFIGGNWKKLADPIIENFTFLDIMPCNIPGNNGIWAASTGNLNQATSGGVYYINPNVFDFTINDYSTTRYGTGNFGGLSSRLASSLAMNNGYVYVGLDRQSTTNEGGVFKMSMTNPALPDYNSFSKVNIDIGAGISYKAIGTRGCEIWLGKNNYCSGTCAAGRIFRYDVNGTFNIPLISQNTSPIPFSTSPGTTNVRAIFTDTITHYTYVGLSAGAGIAIRNAAPFESSLDAPNWTMITPANSPLPTSTIVNFNAITKVAGEVWVGTNKGIFIFSGCDLLKNPSFYKMLTTANGLPSDNITDIAYDSATSQVWVTSPVGVSRAIVNNLVVCSPKSIFLDCKLNPITGPKAEVELLWDYSYLHRNIPVSKPIGVAADGVARIYINVKAGTGSNGNLKNTRIVIRDEPAKPRNMRGKLMAVSIENYFAYSEEANGAAGLEAFSEIYNDGVREIRFWYVAADDFSNDHGMVEADESTRIERVRIYCDYTDRESDSSDIEIQLVRPPLVLVHGLNSGPEAWDKFAPNSGIPFAKSSLFKHVKALKMDGLTIFKTNALTLLSYQQNSNSLRHAISTMHSKGYACAQVDYICHSMGGLMLRSAINDYSRLYLNSRPNDGANYGKGYVHKMIIISSPNNGSPVADLVSELAPALPPVITRIVGGILKNEYLGFVEPKPYLGTFPWPTTFEANGAVKNLATLQKNGGINFGQTNIRNHLLTGNVAWTSAETAETIIAMEPLLSFIDNVLAGARDRAVTPADKAIFTGLQGLTKLARVWSFIERFSKNLGYPNFLGSSDLIVPLASQQARQVVTSPHITNFLNRQGSIIDANHLSVLDRYDFGERVMELLNSPIHSNLFATFIPANVDPEQNSTPKLPENNTEPQNAPLPVSTFYGTSKVALSTPATPAFIVKADSAVKVQLELKDTVGFAYLKVYFQNRDSSTLSREAIQQFIFKVNPQFVDSQLVIAVAVYDKPTQIEYHVDTLMKLVEMNGLPTQFRFVQTSTEVLFKENFIATMEAMYNGKWIAISAANKNLQFTLSNHNTGSINEFNAFVPSNADTVKLIGDFYGLRDTLVISVLAPPLASALNYTIASGNISNPAIWSRGIVPGLLDSVVVKSGHILKVDSLFQVRSLFVEPGGKLEVNAGDTLDIVPVELLGYQPFGVGLERQGRVSTLSPTTAYVFRKKSVTSLRPKLRPTSYQLHKGMLLEHRLGEEYRSSPSCKATITSKEPTPESSLLFKKNPRRYCRGFLLFIG